MASVSVRSLTSTLGSLELNPGKNHSARPVAAKFTISVRSKLAGIKSFTGLSNNVLEFNTKTTEEVSIENGCRTVAMRHRVKKHRLGRDRAHRKALLRNLTTDVLYHGRIRTTVAKAKATQPYVEKMIGLAKKGGVHNYRKALAFVYDEELVNTLFKTVNDKYAERSSGYTRIVTLWENRRGDNAEMAYIELV